MPQPVFLPKTLTVLRGYTPGAFLQDLTAGVTVGMVAIPLAIAFGIASIPEDVAAEAGLSPPVMGLITAIVAGFLISALGGTRVAIGGPTGAFVVILYAIAAEHGYGGLVLATFMAGALLVCMGFARLGGMIKYIPFPVTTGFTTGIAVIILAGQFKDLLGLEMGPLPPDFLSKVKAYVTHIHTIDPTTATMGLAVAAFIYVWPRYVTKRVPGAILALVAATIANEALGLGAPTVGSRFGSIELSLSTFVPRVPDLHLSLGTLRELVVPALTIALLGGIESLLCAVVADGMQGTRHRSNTELIAQGVANLVTPMFGGIPATSAIARTATNVQAGARTPVAGMVHAVTLLIVALALGSYAALIPMCALAGALVVVAYNMSELHRFWWLLKGPRGDALVLLSTFGLTVLMDLTVAVQVGVVLAAILFMKRMADVTNVAALKQDLDERGDGGIGATTGGLDRKPLPGVEIYEINGPFFFGAAYKLRDTLDPIGRRPKALILDMPNVNAIDATGLHVLEELRNKCVKQGTALILSGVHAQPLFAFTQSGLLERFGVENLTGTLREAVERAAALTGSDAGPTRTDASPPGTPGGPSSPSLPAQAGDPAR